MSGNRSNASLSLPGVVSQPDFHFMAVMLIVMGLLCLVMFGAGYLIARAYHADRGGTASLMFGLGTNNNGAGLVLAFLVLSDHPGVMLPIILYNLIQHLVASFVDKALSHGMRWRPREVLVACAIVLADSAILAAVFRGNQMRSHGGVWGGELTLICVDKGATTCGRRNAITMPRRRFSARAAIRVRTFNWPF